MQIVVANLLGKHRSEVTIVPCEVLSQGSGDCSNMVELKLSQDELLKGATIEELIVKELVSRHSIV